LKKETRQRKYEAWKEAQEEKEHRNLIRMVEDIQNGRLIDFEEYFKKWR